MTQSVTKTINNIEQMLSSANTMKKSSDLSSAMDKTKDFQKVFEKTVDNKQTSTEIQPTKETKSIENLDDTQTEQNKILSTEDIKNSFSIERNSIASAEFKEILRKATNEANIEASLDLTLAKDIDEIISQLKDAIESISGLVSEESAETDSEEIILPTEELAIQLENTMASLLNNNEEIKNSNEIKEEVIEVLNNLVANGNLNIESFQKDLIPQKVEIKSNTEQIDFELTQEVVEFTENITDEIIASKQTEDSLSNEIDSLFDEEILKELKIESLSAETDSADTESFMQNQTPEEQALKAIITQEVETFDLKTDSMQTVQNTQNTQNNQVKATDINPSRIIEQVTKHLENLQTNSKVNIVLNPESLGKVNIQLLSTKEGLTAQFTVTTQEARDLLTKGLDGLKETLISHGVGVDNVSVKVADSQKSEYSQDWTEQEGSRGGNKGQGQPNREEKEKGLFEKMMAQTTENENGNV